jgi:hypothetical protein
VLEMSPAVLMFTLLAVILNGPGNGTWATQTFFYSVLFGGSALMFAAELIWRWRSRP